MANFLENYGLGFIDDDDDAVMGLLGYAAQEGKAKTGYYGAPYIFKSMGNFELWVKTEIREEQKSLNVVGFDTHCGGTCVWKMKYSGIDVTPKDASKLERALIFNGTEENAGILPIDVISADVLPSFLAGDEMELQVVALPLSIGYYENEDEYAEAQPKNENGETWLAAVGSLLPVSFLVNHAPSKYEEGKRYENDAHVHFAARVKELYHGTVELNGEKMNMFIRCIAETNFGLLEFDHTLEQVDENMREKIKVGSIISGVCIISGDVAIKEYNKGFVRDFEHNLRLVRYTVMEGDPERLRFVLKDDSVCVCDGSVLAGKQAVIDFVKNIQAERKSKYSADLVTVTAVNAGCAEYPIGTRCVGLRESEKDEYDCTVFVSTDEDGMITKLEFCTGNRYTFEYNG
ncbi:MAG: hypothetical protein IJX46_10265 [Clostridia bacterium]|nr:hypothetical protein [Clostridia bacterium]